MGIFEITTSEAILSKKDTIKIGLEERTGTLNIWAQDVHYFSYNVSYPNILRWADIFSFLTYNLP